METNPNAYKIRLDILKMAHDDCFELFNHKCQSIREKACGVPVAIGTISEEELTAIYPTTEQIMVRAKELYKFICEKA